VTAPAKQAAQQAKADAGARAENRAAADTAPAPEAKDAKVQGIAEAVAVPEAPAIAGGNVAALRKAAVLPPFELASSIVRLRVVNGRFDRSVDGGTTWTTERTGVAARVLSGDCPTADVCWLAGDAGQVFVRTAGGGWADRPIADVRAGVSAITASSIDAAIATLADGRRFSTADGGHTWTLAR
jgi:hypothetical protein